MPEPRKFPSLDSCQKRFLWTHKEVDLAPRPVVGLVLQAGDTEKFPQALGFESLDPIFRVSKQGPCFTAVEKDGGDKGLVQLELLPTLKICTCELWLQNDMRLHLHSFQQPPMIHYPPSAIFTQFIRFGQPVLPGGKTMLTSLRREYLQGTQLLVGSLKIYCPWAVSLFLCLSAYTGRTGGNSSVGFLR